MSNPAIWYGLFKNCHLFFTFMELAMNGVALFFSLYSFLFTHLCLLNVFGNPCIRMPFVFLSIFFTIYNKSFFFLHYYVQCCFVTINWSFYCFSLLLLRKNNSVFFSSSNFIVVRFNNFSTNIVISMNIQSNSEQSKENFKKSTR